MLRWKQTTNKTIGRSSALIFFGAQIERNVKLKLGQKFYLYFQKSGPSCSQGVWRTSFAWGPPYRTPLYTAHNVLHGYWKIFRDSSKQLRFPYSEFVKMTSHLPHWWRQSRHRLSSEVVSRLLVSGLKRAVEGGLWLNWRRRRTDGQFLKIFYLKKGEDEVLDKLNFWQEMRMWEYTWVTNHTIIA